MTRAGRAWAAGLAALLALIVTLLVSHGSRGSSTQAGQSPATRVTSSAAAASGAPTAAAPGNPDGTAPAPAAAVPPSSRPVRVQIPAIAVDSSLQPLGINRDGSLESPSEWQRAGWYAGGVRPGDVGPAVIAGHIDSVSGPAVFYRLDELRPGDRVTVTRADGRRLIFSVDGTSRYAKRSFPTEAVYGPASLPLLRLVTCTGDFDAQTHSYLDNLVVTSHLVSR